MPRVPDLFFTLPDGRTLTHRLAHGPSVIGRDTTCEIVIDDPSTSRRHAQLTPIGDSFVVSDLDSRNGTLVNDAAPTSAPLRDGDRIMVGAVLALYRGGASGTGTSVVIAEDEGAVTHATRYVPKGQELDLSRQRLQMIYDLSERLTTLQDRDSLLEEALSICFETLHFERGAVGIKRRDSRAVDWPVVKNLRGAQGELTISRGLLKRAIENGERAIFTDSGNQNIDPTVSMVQQGIRSAMCVPLLQGEEILGVLYGDRTSTSTAYTNEDIDFLAAIARQITIGLVNAQLLEDQKSMATLQRDLDTARKIQNNLFPRNLPDEKGLSVAALNDPGRRVSGDYYDVIIREDGRVVIVVADVTGEGVAAALLVASLQAAVRATIDEASDPGKLLFRWNNLIYHNASEGKFITCLLMSIDPAARHMRMASAGHWGPIAIRTNGDTPAEIEVDAGFPLGVIEGAEFETHKVDLGDDPVTLFSYTDGVIEAMDVDENMYGNDHLIAALKERADATPSAIVKHIRKQLTTFAGPAQQSDDITMLAVRLS
jgi:phosphoserine phosphatase RsbU/P